MKAFLTAGYSSVGRTSASIRHKALTLGEDNELVNHIPKFPWQHEKGNVWQGLVQRDTYHALRDELGTTAPHAQLALVVALIRAEGLGAGVYCGRGTYPLSSSSTGESHTSPFSNDVQNGTRSFVVGSSPPRLPQPSGIDMGQWPYRRQAMVGMQAGDRIFMLLRHRLQGDVDQHHVSEINLRSGITR